MRNPLQSVFNNQFAQIQENITRAIEELDQTTLEGSAGGGAVKVQMTGSGEVLSVVISPAAVAEDDIELLQDLVCAAVRDAYHKALALKKEKLVGATPFGALGLDLPNIF